MNAIGLRGLTFLSMVTTLASAEITSSGWCPPLPRCAAGVPGRVRGLGTSADLHHVVRIAAGGQHVEGRSVLPRGRLGVPRGGSWREGRSAGQGNGLSYLPIHSYVARFRTGAFAGGAASNGRSSTIAFIRPPCILACVLPNMADGAALRFFAHVAGVHGWT